MSVIYKNGTYYGAGGGGEGADTKIITDDFDPTESYAVGDYVVYEGDLYKCTTAHTGEWNAYHFDATQVMKEVPQIMPSADMSEVVTPLPSVMSRRFKYSTAEQVIGEWIDGKPIYEKTVDCGALPNNTDKTVAHGITNFKQTINISGRCYKSDFSDSFVLPYPTPTASNAISVMANATNVVIKTGANRSAYDKSYITIQYTKTTD